MYIKMYFLALFCIITLCMWDIAAQTASMGRLTKQEKIRILHWHNVYRKMVKQGEMGYQPRGLVNPLKWSNGLARLAQKFISATIQRTRQCPQGHSRGNRMMKGGQILRVGENIAWGPRNFKDRLTNWVDEHKLYTFRNTSMYEAAHYTQVVWGNTTMVGCAVGNNCKMMGYTHKIILVCNYAPAGNYQGEYPYKLITGNQIRSTKRKKRIKRRKSVSEL